MELFDLAFYMERVIPKLNKGLVESLWLIIPAALIGGSFGIFMGVLRVFGTKWIKKTADTFVAVIRGVPLTIQLMILYFGLPYLPFIKIYLTPYQAALIGFIFCTGA